MKKWLVRWNTQDGEYDKAWCYANNAQEAADNIQHEYWNVAEITYVEELND